MSERQASPVKRREGTEAQESDWRVGLGAAAGREALKDTRNGRFRVAGLAVVRGVNWRLKGMGKEILLGGYACVKPRSRRLYSFSGFTHKIRNGPEWPQEHRLVSFHTVPPDFISCPHPETPTPDNSVYRSTRKRLGGIVRERDVVIGRNYRKCER